MSVLTTKLYLPPTREGSVSRPRLRERLDAALSLGQRLILISAPAGYGKTTLVTDWLEHLDLPYVWFSLDEGDNDPVRFLQYLSVGLQQANAKGSLQADNPSGSPPSSLESGLTGLVNDMVSLGTPLLLVLDDYHTIRTPAIHDAVEFLLQHAPPTLLLIIITREDPPLTLSHLRGRAQLTEIRADDLQFTLEEATSFFAQTLGLTLEEEMVHALQARTEGWIAGLQLAGMSLQGGHDRARFIAEFTGSHRYILDYLVEQVLSYQSQSVKDFLLRTSILDRLSGPLCDAVIGHSDGASQGQAMLGWLEQRDLFLIRLDDERHWYRYHHLFRDFLQVRLNKTQPPLVPELHRRAMEWYEQNGLPAEAIGHALLAQEYEYAARLIEQSALSMIKRSEISTWQGWLAALPDEVRQEHLALSLYYAWILVRTGQLGAAEELLAPLSKGNLPPQVANLLDVVWAQLFLLNGDPIHMAEYADRALTAEQQRPETGDEFHLIMISSAAVLLAEAQRLQGKIKTAMQTYRRSLAKVKPEEVDASWLPAVGLLGMRLGLLLYEQNDLEAAEQHVTHCLAIARRSRNELNEAQGHMYLAMIEQAQGKPDHALEMMLNGSRLAHKVNLAHVVLYFDALQARLMLIRGNLLAASTWASSYQPGSKLEGQAGLRIEFVRRFADCVWARVLLMEDKPAEAARFLEELRSRAESGGQMGIVIETLALQALAFQALGETGRAYSLLDRALTLAEPEGYIRTFVDEGEPMRSMLQARRLKVTGSQPMQEYLARLLAAFAPRETPTYAQPSNVQPSNLQPLVEPLTDRERQVMELLVQGLSNPEIAERLTITIGTVKRHTWNTYAKLGVTNRTNAILKARELGLL